MKWTVVVAATALWACCCPAAALAQPVFFDDFDGPDFLPHWRTPDPARWEYNISGGMLHVTDLLHPSVAKLEANFAIIGAAYAPQSDFRLDVWMGWDDPPSTQFHELFVTVNSRAGILAEFGLISLGGISEAVAASGAGAVSREPPLPGMHQFTIARTGSQFDFYLDGAPFASLPDPVGLSAEGLSLFFSKPFPGEMIPYHVDRVVIVPAQGTIVVPAACMLVYARRRRR